MKKFWKIVNKAKDTAEILLYEQFGKDFFSDEGIAAKDFAADLKALGDIKNIDIRINSAGGSVFEGLAIYNILKTHKAQITVYIDGLAASIASVVAMAGDLIVMPENSLLMIHDPSGLTMGSAEEMRKTADLLDKIKESLVMAYKAKSGLPEEEIADLMTAETWLNGKEAKEKGFCDECIEPMKMAASASGFYALKNQLTSYGKDSHEEPKHAAAAAIKTKEVVNMKCTIHACDLVDGKCPMCIQAAADAERQRTVDILALGKEHGYIESASTAVKDGRTVDQFRQEVLNNVKNKVKPDTLHVTVESAAAKKPFARFGEQLTAIANVARGRASSADIERLMNIQNAATGASGAVPSDGGFLIQQDFTTALLPAVAEESILYKKTFNVPIGPNANGLRAPIMDETSRATGSRFGGVQVYRTNEAPDLSSLGKKPKFALLELYLEDLFGICFATDDLLADATALEAIIMQVFPSEMGFTLDDEIVRGSGSGRMLGILNSGALVSVAKETGQAGTTIEIENIVNMVSRMPARSFARAEWYVNQDCLPQIYTLMLGNFPIYMPPGGASSTPYGMLYGKPLNVIEQADTLGTKGDILLLDLSQYITIDKGGLDAQQSIHVKFLTDEKCFRFKMRNNGQPAWKSSKVPYKGSNSVSPFISLDTRA